MDSFGHWRRIFTTIGLSLALAAPAAGAKADDLLAKVKANGEMVVATEMQFAPFDFVVDGKQTGYNLDLFTQIGKELGVKVHFVDLPWPSVLPGLVAKKYDIVAGPVIVTKERMKRFRYTIPIAGGAFSVIKRASDKSINQPDDLAGKTVGAAKATTALVELEKLAKTLKPPVDVRQYVDLNEELADLSTNRLDAVVSPTINAAYAVKLRSAAFALIPKSFGAVSYVAYVGRKTDESKPLMDAVDAAILKIKKDGRLAAMQNKWFGQTIDLPDSLLSMED